MEAWIAASLLFIRIPEEAFLRTVSILSPNYEEFVNNRRERQRKFLTESALFRQPEVSAVGRQLASAAKVVRFAGDEINRASGVCVKVRCVRYIVRVYRHQNAFAIAGTFKDQLAVCHNKDSEIAVTQGFAAGARPGKFPDPFRQFVFLRSVEAGAKRVIAVFLAALSAPLAAIVDARDSGHAEQQGIEEG